MVRPMTVRPATRCRAGRPRRGVSAPRLPAGAPGRRQGRAARVGTACRCCQRPGRRGVSHPATVSLSDSQCTGVRQRYSAIGPLRGNPTILGGRARSVRGMVSRVALPYAHRVGLRQRGVPQRGVPQRTRRSTVWTLKPGSAEPRRLQRMPACPRSRVGRSHPAPGATGRPGSQPETSRCASWTAPGHPRRGRVVAAARHAGTRDRASRAPSAELLTRKVAARPMTGWGGEVAGRHLRLVFSREPVDQLASLGERVRGALAALGADV
jgi:hypothetical protein